MFTGDALGYTVYKLPIQTDTFWYIVSLRFQPVNSTATTSNIFSYESGTKIWIHSFHTLEFEGLKAKNVNKTLSNKSHPAITYHSDRPLSTTNLIISSKLLNQKVRSKTVAFDDLLGWLANIHSLVVKLIRFDSLWFSLTEIESSNMSAFSWNFTM